MKHEFECIINSNESLAENKTKNEIEQLLSKYKHGMILMNMENGKMWKLHVEKYKSTV